MSSDLFFTQLVSQNFSSGSCYENVSSPVAAGALRNTTANDELAPSDNNFENMLQQVSENKAASKAAKPSDTQGTAPDEDAGRIAAGNDDLAGNSTNTDNLIGVNNQMASVSNAVNAAQALALEQMNIPDLLKQLGIETLAVDENGRLLSAAVNGANPGLANAPGEEAVRITQAAALDLDKLEALLKQFQSNPDAKPSAEIRSLVELFNGLSGDHPLKNAKTVEMVNLLQNLSARPNALLVEGEVQNQSTGMQTGAAAKEAAGGLLTALTSDLSLLNAQSDTMAMPQDTAKSASNLGTNAEDKHHLARLAPSVTIKGTHSGDQAVAQKPNIDVTRASIAASDGLKLDIKGLKDAMGLQQKNSAEVSGNNTEPALFSNSSSNKNENNLPHLKPLNLKADSSATEALGSKIMNTDSCNKNDGFSFSSQFQNEFKTSEKQHLAKEAEIVHKDLRSQTLNQIVQKAVLHLKNGQNEVRMNLKPDFLGQIRMQIITDSQQVTVRIITEFPMVKELIENNVQQLKSDLQNHGLEIDELEVSVSQNPDQQVADRQKASAANGKNSSEGDDDAISV
jgi:hypothetical protein